MTPDEHLEALRSRLRYMLYAERVTRILCRRSGEVEGYRWRDMSPGRQEARRLAGYPPALTSHRDPPLPFHSFVHRGRGTCRVCGQPIYGGGSFRRQAGTVSKRLTWHTLCTGVYLLMRKPGDYSELLVHRQGGLCAITSEPIGPPERDYVSYVEVDHEVPLFRVARDHAGEPWHELLRFWMTGNLRALTKAAHADKGSLEARERAGHRPAAPGQEAML